MKYAKNWRLQGFKEPEPVFKYGRCKVCGVPLKPRQDETCSIVCNSMSHHFGWAKKEERGPAYWRAKSLAELEAVG